MGSRRERDWQEFQPIAKRSKPEIKYITHLRINDPKFLLMLHDKFRNYERDADVLNNRFVQDLMTDRYFEAPVPIIALARRVARFVQLPQFRRYFLVYLPAEAKILFGGRLNIDALNIYNQLPYDPDDPIPAHPFMDAINNFNAVGAGAWEAHRLQAEWDAFREALREASVWCEMRALQYMAMRHRFRDSPAADDLYEMLASKLNFREIDGGVIED